MHNRYNKRIGEKNIDKQKVLRLKKETYQEG